jgi:RNA polymerase sigma-70 factor (ECF subfamily)
MSAEVEDIKTLLRRVIGGSPEAAERFCRDYQPTIRRVVRRRLPQRLRARYDSLDFVNDVWLSFFSKPPADAKFEDPEELTRYLAQIARNKINEVQRRARSPKEDQDREQPLNARPDDQPLPAADPTPSQIVGAEDEFHKMCRDRRPIDQQILQLLRQGHSYREIANALNTHEKTIWRLVRRLDPEAPRPCLPS